jgi:hypothetical protein
MSESIEPRSSTEPDPLEGLDDRPALLDSETMRAPEQGSRRHGDQGARGAQAESPEDPAEPRPFEDREEQQMSTTVQPPRYDDDYEQDDWLEEPLPGRPRRRLLTPVTALLFAALAGAICFIVGVQVEKGQVSTTTVASGRTAGAGAGRFAAALAGGAAGTGGAASGAAASGSGGTGGTGTGTGGTGTGTTVGTVANVSGSDLYVTNVQGNTVKVVTSAGSSITKQVTAKAHDVHPGDTVVVAGPQNPDGSIEATTVRDQGSSGSGLGALFGGGGGGASLFGSGGGRSSGGGDGSSSSSSSSAAGGTGSGGGGGQALFGSGGGGGSGG